MNFELEKQIKEIIRRKVTIVLCKEQAGAELGQGQLKLKLGFISIKI